MTPGDLGATARPSHGSAAPIVRGGAAGQRVSVPSVHTEASDLTARNIEAIATLERDALHGRSALDRITDRIMGLAGSPVFLAVHALWFVIWIVLNTRRSPPLDPYPFNLLTLIVSLEAIVLTGVVLMTQSRMTRQADKRAHLDLQVNLLAEQELTAILHMLHALCQHAGVAVTIRDARVEQLLQETDIHRMAEAIERELGTDAAGGDAERESVNPAAERQPLTTGKPDKIL